MPPKKDMEKAIAAETKKENTLKAKKILDELKKDLAKDGGSKSSANKPEKPVRSNKRQAENKDIADKPKRSKLNSTTDSKVQSALKPTSESGNDAVKPSGHNEIPERNETPPNCSVSGQSQSIRKPVDVSKPRPKSFENVANKKSVVRSSVRSSHGSGYQYEIDCENVADTINVNDLKVHLEKHLKIDGKKNNFGNTVSIVCEGQKAIIKSKTFFPKKSLRFLSKKFLKKNWNIRVLSKNSHSYEYKYVGML